MREVVERYAVSYVVCGPLEEKTYGSPRQRLDQFTDVLRPVYQGTGTVVYAVVPSQGGGSISARVDRATPVVTSLPPRSAAARAPDQGAVLQEPRGIFRSAEGTVYVADFGKDRVALFDSALRYLESWGERGEQPGALHSPSAVAVGKEGRVYVADTWNGRVQVFDRAGRRAFEISDDFFGPRGVAISPEGDVFVSDTGNGRIVRFTPEGTRRLVFGNEGDRARRLKDPVGLAFDPTGTLWVCDNGNGRLVSFSRDGAFLKAIPVPGWRTAPLSEPHVAFDRRGSAWITVPLENEVRTVDTATGQVVRTIRSGETGQEPFDRPLGIAVDPRTQLVLVSDVAGRLSWLRPVKSVRF